MAVTVGGVLYAVLALATTAFGVPHISLGANSPS